ncbi:monovalent cation/H(+) antiporter subunit G [Pontibacter sp. JH31]|uniref:Monovalent cation/H(+) antiporter subunit G n=1 Tax=Pontibacter aquaedesilientis TaxID=2766980 RepID=A0ABR7XCP8_9BACT|nr:monovalent cation/H(+) antiporter subunit G [Pontibacter aquaedesilientis]MBD1396072.1 monovalent cation/H(+) antiporter subunit G [Pontibacter aquaedesilientis]
MLENVNFLLIREIISSVFIIIGVMFMLIATIGLLRFPDFYIRMSAITKGATLGLGLILTGMGIYFNEPDMFLKVALIISFTFITSPVAAHVIGRTAVRNKIPFWPKTNLDEFKGYLRKDHMTRNHQKEEKEQKP